MIETQSKNKSKNYIPLGDVIFPKKSKGLANRRKKQKPQSCSDLQEL
jgi:hypothetical protein